MPMTFETDRSMDLTIFTADGDVTHEELISNLESYIEAGTTHHELYDFSSGTGNTLTFENISQMTEVQKSRYPRKTWKTAIVVHREYGFNMGRIYQGMTEVEGTGQVIQVFPSLDDAYVWLNIPQEESGD